MRRVLVDVCAAGGLLSLFCGLYLLVPAFCLLAAMALADRG